MARPYAPDRMGPKGGEACGCRHPRQSLDAQQSAVGAETAVAGQSAPREEIHGVHEDCGDEADEQHSLAVEDAVDQRPLGGRGGDDDDHSQGTPGDGRLANHRPPADAADAPGDEGPADLLLERQKQAGSSDEHDRPEQAERRVAGRAERP